MRCMASDGDIGLWDLVSLFWNRRAVTYDSIEFQPKIPAALEYHESQRGHEFFAFCHF